MIKTIKTLQEETEQENETKTPSTQEETRKRKTSRDLGGLN